MDKKTFVEKLGLIPNLYDKIVLAEKTGKTVYSSDFYPPNVWGPLTNMEGCFDLTFHTCGIFDDSERRVIGMSRSGEFRGFPVRLVKIEASTKFSDIGHKDYLGAIMSLGIKRERFGDLILEEGACFAAVHEEVCGYLQANLVKVKNSPCRVVVLDPDSTEKPGHRFEMIRISSSSLRLDCITAGICGISRTKSDELIRQGKVLVNYAPATKRDLEIKENDLISIRGHGKFIFNEIEGSTRSGRLKIELKKFI
ncbi:MAG: putative binding protein [Firmicutes bacterium]|nr:putative binding protein [Bacillota bacterium]